jgi:two-component system response regulator MprA
VLVVDDDTSVRESLGRALRSENYDVALAGDGQEALRSFNEGYVDLVLLDLNIPLKGGWDVFERISALNPLLPIIIITARSEQYELAATAGASALMEKPLSLPLLLGTITKLMNEPVAKRLHRIVTHQPILVVPGS